MPPRALVPVGAACSAALVAASELGGPLPVTSWSSYTGSKLAAFAPVAAAVLATTVLGLAATAVLWPRAEDQDNGALGERTVVDETVEEVVAPDTAVARPELRVTPSSPGSPTVTDTDLHRRR